MLNSCDADEFFANEAPEELLRARLDVRDRACERREVHGSDELGFSGIRRPLNRVNLRGHRGQAMIKRADKGVRLHVA